MSYGFKGTGPVFQGSGFFVEKHWDGRFVAWMQLDEYPWRAKPTPMRRGRAGSAEFRSLADARAAASFMNARKKRTDLTR